MKTKYIFTIFIAFCSVLFSCSHSQEKRLSDKYFINYDGSMTDHDKQNINHYNYFVEMADSLIFYCKNNDIRHAGLCINEMNHSRDKISWFSHPNDKLKKLTSENISRIQLELDSIGVPQEITYPITVEEIYINPKNDIIDIDAFSPMNNFKLYNASLDSEGNLVRTVHRRHVLYHSVEFPYDESKTIKDLNRTYTLKLRHGMKVMPVNF